MHITIRLHCTDFYILGCTCIKVQLCKSIRPKRNIHQEVGPIPPHLVPCLQGTRYKQPCNQPLEEGVDYEQEFEPNISI